MTQVPKDNQLGMIHFYYGKGTGKTSIVLGRIMRCLGHNMRPILVQFLKKHDPTGSKGFYYGEYITLQEKLSVPVLQFGGYNFVRTPEQIEANKNLAKQVLEETRKILQNEKYDLVVLDEIGSMLELGLYQVSEIRDILLAKRKQIEVLLTGHTSYNEIIEISDYVTHLEEIKHPYQQGIQAREGIEF